MLNSFVFIISLALIIGGFVGFFYQYFFIFILDVTCGVLKKIKLLVFFNLYKYISIFFSVILTFMLFLVVRLFYGFIENYFWEYFYKTYFLGIIIGGIVKRFLGEYRF